MQRHRIAREMQTVFGLLQKIKLGETTLLIFPTLNMVLNV